MKKKAVLSPEDRDFFSLVLKSNYMNPFSDERDKILSQIIPQWYQEPATAPELNEHIEKLEHKGITRIQQFDGNDQHLMLHAYLLQIYIEVLPDFEKLIQDQIRQPRASLKVPFAKKTISRIRMRGIIENDSTRYFALFYQLYRAYYFIIRSLVGDCPSMKQLRFTLWNNVFTYDLDLYDRHLWGRMEDFSTLLLGETGSGKGSAAASIGRSGYIPFDLKTEKFVDSFMETFIQINLSQFPESLIESELFGHRKGAFTGAVENHIGLFERCKTQGSLFLDEIGDITIPVQIKLLQVLEERLFTPVGSHSQKHFEGRVIAATNRSIEELRRKGSFRDDFFYRLCSDIITVPTLRQRIEESPSELELMVNLLVSRTTGEDNLRLTGMILETLMQDLRKGYQWPGNVRELAQAIRRILLTQHYKGDVMLTTPDPEEAFAQKIISGTLEVRELLEQYCRMLFKRHKTYEEVARRTNLDPRTVKKYLK